LERFRVPAREIMVRATRVASGIEGTSAELVSGCYYCLEDLLYGMMLPSGNDAAFLLA
jgi:D-alanyl-D-alanine carboxypeptidase